MAIVLGLLGKQGECALRKAIQDLGVCDELLVGFGGVQNIVAELGAQLT